MLKILKNSIPVDIFVRICMSTDNTSLNIYFVTTAAFTYYYDPTILQNKLTPLSIFRDLALRKSDSKRFMFYFHVFFIEGAYE